MNAHKFFNLLLAIVFAFSLLGMPAPASAQGVTYGSINTNLAANSVQGNGWPLGNVVTLTVHDPLTPPSSDIMITDISHVSSWDSNHFVTEYDLSGKINLKPGFVLTMTDGTATQTLTIVNLQVTSVDRVTDTVSGIAPAGMQVDVNIDNAHRTTNADVDGNWTVDFSKAGPQDNEKVIFDILGDTVGWASARNEGDVNSTSTEWIARLPFIQVNIDDYRVWANDWPLGAQLTMTISGVGVNYSTQLPPPTRFGCSLCTQSVFVYSTNYHLQAGDVITITDGTLTKSYTVSPLRVTHVDLQADTISGIATPNSRVAVWDGSVAVCCNTRRVTADGSGHWFADFSIPGDRPVDIVDDLTAGSFGQASENNSVGYVDNKGDETWVDWSTPSFTVAPSNDWIEAGGWPFGTQVTITIDDPNTPESPDFTTAQTIESLHHYQSNFDFSAGDTITLTDGYTTKSLVVADIQVMSIDVVNDRITGITTPNSRMWVFVNDPENTMVPVQSDNQGNWVADFSGKSDLQANSTGSIKVFDLDNDVTHVDWHVPNPVIKVWLGSNNIDGYDWKPNTLVTVTVGNYSDQQYSDNWGNLQFHPGNKNFTLAPEQTVTMTDGITTKTHEITHVTITTADTQMDTVTGIATPGSLVGICIHISGCLWRWETADTEGEWVADFSVEQNGNPVYDIKPGTDMDAVQWEDDGDGTGYLYHVPNPNFGVRVNYDKVEAFQWAIGDHLTLEIYNINTPTNPDCIATQTVGVAPWDPSQTYVSFDLSGKCDIQPGDHVSVSNGTITKTTIVTILAFTDFNLDTDMVYGIAEPNQVVNVWTCWQNNCVNRDETADANGYWVTNFSIPGEQGTIDLRPGSWIDSDQRDDDGDATFWGESVPNPTITVRMIENEVHANGWMPIGEMVTLTIDDPSTTDSPDFTKSQPSMPADWDPNQAWMRFTLGDFKLQPGFTVTLKNAKMTKVHDVMELTVTNIDLAADTIEGISAPNQEVWVDVWNVNVTRRIVADANGHWLADFSTPGDEDWENQTTDLKNGSQGEANSQDDDNDTTAITWSVPTPRLKVELSENRIYGFEWTDGAPVTLTIDDPTTTQIPDFSSTQIAQVISEDREQAVVSFDPGGLTLRPGLLVTMTDGITMKTHTIFEFSWRAIDYTIDVISGMAEPEMDTYIWASNENGGMARHFQPNADGSWTADFAVPGNESWETIFDIQEGMSGGMVQIDADRDETIKRWTDISIALNQPPVIANITAPISPVQLGQSIDATVTFSDPDVGDSHTVAWNWDDSTTTTVPASVPSVTTLHTYASPGVYTITATITDAAGESASAVFQYVVIYDPDGGFVTGGGWINSPLGAYTPNPSLTGKATFGFVSKYQKGATVPTGNTEFQFHVAGMNFKSTSYDWLVVAGTKAQYKGTGTINGTGNYGFLLTAIDGSPDKFRIKIWDKVTGDVIYDNQLGTSDTADPTTVIQGGSIVVQKAK